MCARASVHICRVAHAARKHLLLASAVDEMVESAASVMEPGQSNREEIQTRVTYVTLAPESVKMKPKLPLRSGAAGGVTLGRPNIALLRHRPNANGSAV